MLIEEIIEFEVKRPGSPCCTSVHVLLQLSRQNKNLKEKSLSRLVFTAKILQSGQCV